MHHHLWHHRASQPAPTNRLFLCGRYEGVDQRVIDSADMMEVSIGDYILSGGETAALTVMDSVIRLLPGVMGKEASHREESFETGLLEHSHYTQPRVWNGIEAPEILASVSYTHLTLPTKA